MSIIRDVEGGAAEYLRLVEDGEGGAKREGLSCGRELSMAVSMGRARELLGCELRVEEV